MNKKLLVITEDHLPVVFVNPNVALGEIRCLSNDFEWDKCMLQEVKYQGALYFSHSLTNNSCIYVMLERGRVMRINKKHCFAI